jgi:hypothetical protein
LIELGQPTPNESNAMKTRLFSIFAIAVGIVGLSLFVILSSVQIKSISPEKTGVAPDSPGASSRSSLQGVSSTQISEITSTSFVTTFLPLVSKNHGPCTDLTRMEANYILACQYMNNHDPAYGAINNIYGNPTWVVPSENAMAILGLKLASQIQSDSTYLDRAQLAVTYLITIQDPIDGAWYNRYNYTATADLNKSPRQTAEVMIALYKLGYDHSRYNAMIKGAQYLTECQKVQNKGGIDDGLLGGGKNASGQYSRWRWTHDNAYAYLALKAAEAWATIEGDVSKAAGLAASAQKIINGINTFLYDPNTHVWYIAIDENGNPQKNAHLPCLNSSAPACPSWIQYAPQMLDLPVNGVNTAAVGEWIKNAFQSPDGSCLGCLGYDCEGGQLKTRLYPGFAFQAALCWYDTGHASYANWDNDWAKKSGLWQTTADGNNATGGWIDWVEVTPTPGRKPDGWQRFIDTSFYSIASCNGGYDFRIP